MNPNYHVLSNSREGGLIVTAKIDPQSELTLCVPNFEDIAGIWCDFVQNYNGLTYGRHRKEGEQWVMAYDPEIKLWREQVAFGPMSSVYIYMVKCEYEV